MKIGAPELVEHEGSSQYRVAVDTAAGRRTLWYGVEPRFAGYLTDSADAALVALLLPAMASGEDVHLAGTVSERLWYNVSGPYQRLLQLVFPDLHAVRILPSALQSSPPKAAGVATGFSCGIDSYCALADHYYADGPAALKVSHLLYNNVGSHGKDGERLFRERFARVQPVAERMQLPLVAVHSNLDTFYGQQLGFLETHPARNASVPLLLQRGIGHYLYASGHTYKDVTTRGTRNMGYVDTISLPLLSTGALEVVPVGGQYTRVEKTLRVSTLTDSYDTLDVCVRGTGAGNCSTCWKCLRTLLTLEIAGAMDRYADVFDFGAYRRHRTGYCGRVLRSKSPLVREIADFAAARGFTFPARAYLSAPLAAARLLLRRTRRQEPSAHRTGAAAPAP